MMDNETRPESPAETSDDVRYAPRDDESAPAAESFDSPFVPETAADALDIDAALAAVATLDDILAEQEAAEQARAAREEAEAEARAQRQARLSHPEQFFPMPPLTTLQRGRIDSLVPALILIGVGAWLTLTMTAGASPSPALIALVAAGAVGLTLLVRWIASGRWASGSLFFALTVLFVAGAGWLLTTRMNFAAAWPLLLVALGAALALTGVLAQPSQRRLVFSGVLVAFAGVVAFVVTSGLLP